MAPDETRITGAPSLLQRRDIGAQRSQPVAAQFALGAVHQQRRADLHHDQLGAGKNIAHRRCFFLARLRGLAYRLGLGLGLAGRGFCLGLDRLGLDLGVAHFPGGLRLGLSMGVALAWPLRGRSRFHRLRASS